MNTIYTLIPLLVIVAAALLVMILEVFFKTEERSYLAYISLLFLIASGAACVKFWNKGYAYFDGSLSLSNLSLFLIIILIVSTFLVILISMKYLTLQKANYGEYYALLLFALSGMIIMVSSSDLIVIFLGLEVLSLSSYALAGLRREDEKSNEAAVKYFLLGSFASAFLVLGIAFLYGATQATAIPSIVQGLQSGASTGALGLVGLGLIVIGFGFKVAVVPFHMWTPDVYQGAPTPITAFFSVGPKAVGFIVLLRIFAPYFQDALKSELMFGLLWIIAAITMIAGNLIALRQTNIKRILAYSSIAHAGYLMVAVLARDTQSLVFYLTSYLFMNIGAFAAVISLGKKDHEYQELEDYRGIGFRYPWIGATFAVFLISLAGFPPTGGFLAKFYVFSAAVRQGLVSLVIIGVLASLVSVFYYLRIIIYMYMKEPSIEVDINVDNPSLFLALFLCLYGVLQLGIFPGNILLLIKQAVESLPLL
jgi:NADH-quinone oxidoreductase subunit N